MRQFLRLKGSPHEQARPDYVIPGLAVGTVGALIGTGGLGKSLLALQIAAAVAGGQNGLGLVEGPSGRAVILNGEDPIAVLRERLDTIRQQLTPVVQEVVHKHLLVVAGTGNLLDKRWREETNQLVGQARLVVIDTLQCFHSLDENSSYDMARVVRAMREIARTTGAAILFIHHTNKHLPGDAQQAIRGSSLLTDSTRFQMNLSKNGQGVVRLTFSKVNYAAPRVMMLRYEQGVFVEASHRPAEKKA
jgi:RecA-family ATPase